MEQLLETVKEPGTGQLLEIVKEPDARLHQKSSNVLEINDDTRTLMKNMKYTMMHPEINAIGVAAVQVGVLENVIVIDSDKCIRYEINKLKHLLANCSDPEEKISINELISWHESLYSVIEKPLYVINAKITLHSDTKYLSNEGCLSFPGIKVDVMRYSEIEVHYLDQYGNEQIIYLKQGLFSDCMQHEIDHTNGVVFTDHGSKFKRDFFLKKMLKLSKKQRALKVQQYLKNVFDT